MAFELGGGIAGCTLLGWWIDRTFGTGHKAVIVCAVLGCVGGMYHLISQAFLIQRRTDASDRQESKKIDDGESPKH